MSFNLILKDEIVKKPINKKAFKKKKKKSGAKIWQEKPNENEIQKTNIANKNKFQLKKLGPNLKDLKIRGGIQNHF